MKNLFIALLFLIFAIVACHNSQKKTGAGVGSTEIQKVEKEVVFDPDTTDTIPGDRYMLYSNSEKTAGIVRKSLATLLKDDLEKNLIDENSRKFVLFEFDLNDDGNKEIFVGFTGPYFCGSGGCTQMILDSEGNLITRFTVADYPVVVDRSKTNGWRDLFIQSRGKYHIMKFDGKKYPGNPSVQPELKLIPGDELPRVLNFVNEPYPWFKF